MNQLASRGRGAKAKGAAAERELADILTEKGIPSKRTPMSGAGNLPGDINMHDPMELRHPFWREFHLEAKRQETIKIHEWTKQAEDDAREGMVPLLAYRRNRDKWRIVLSLDDFLDLWFRANDLD